MFLISHLDFYTAVYAQEGHGVLFRLSHIRFFGLFIICKGSYFIHRIICISHANPPLLDNLSS
jgi:hypothetical protein